MKILSIVCLFLSFASFGAIERIPVKNCVTIFDNERHTDHMDASGEVSDTGFLTINRALNTISFEIELNLEGKLWAPKPFDIRNIREDDYSLYAEHKVSRKFLKMRLFRRTESAQIAQNTIILTRKKGDHYQIGVFCELN